MLSALILCVLLCYWYIPPLNIRTDKGLLFLGISLSLFIPLFDIVLGRFVFKAESPISPDGEGIVIHKA